jgi:hypothetical protein
MEMAGKGGITLDIDTDDGACGRSFVRLVRLDNRWDAVVMQAGSFNNYLVLPEGKYFPQQVSCTFGHGNGGKVIKTISDLNPTQELPKGTPIVTVKAGYVSDYGSWRITQSGQLDDGVPGLIGGTKTGYLKILPTTPARKLVMQQNASLHGRLIEQRPEFHGLQEVSARR